jgi:hypothetical protein
MIPPSSKEVVVSVRPGLEGGLGAGGGACAGRFIANARMEKVEMQRAMLSFITLSSKLKKWISNVAKIVNDFYDNMEQNLYPELRKRFALA